MMTYYEEKSNEIRIKLYKLHSLIHLFMKTEQRGYQNEQDAFSYLDGLVDDIKAIMEVNNEGKGNAKTQFMPKNS